MITYNARVFTDYEQNLYSCDCATHTRMLSQRDYINSRNLSYYDTVFVITSKQAVSKPNYYHFLIKQISILAVFTKYLQQRPDL